VRVLRVVVRAWRLQAGQFLATRSGSASILTVDNDSVALRRQIWLLTDEAQGSGDAYAESLH
jgi:hypothetical protein